MKVVIVRMNLIQGNGTVVSAILSVQVLKRYVSSELQIKLLQIKLLLLQST